MPFIQIEILKGRTKEKKIKMMKNVTTVVADALECPEDAVKICIREMELEHYCVAGIPWSEKKELPYKL